MPAAHSVRCCLVYNVLKARVTILSVIQAQSKKSDVRVSHESYAHLEYLFACQSPKKGALVRGTSHCESYQARQVVFTFVLAYVVLAVAVSERTKVSPGISQRVVDFQNQGPFP